MSDKCCCGNEGVVLIYACSGAANTGYLADSVSRKLMKDGLGTMTCLSGIGADLSGFIESAKSVRNIVIDGCPVACGKKIFENKGLPCNHYILTKYGIEKGKTVIDETVINKVYNEISKDLKEEK